MKIELDLTASSPPEEWGVFSLRLIEHGRQVCDAKRPRCDVCVLADICPSAFRVGPLGDEGEGEGEARVMPSAACGHLLHVARGAVERAARAEQGPFGGEQLAS